MLCLDVFLQDKDAEMLPFEYANRSVSQRVIDCLGLEVGDKVAAYLLDSHHGRVMHVAVVIRDYLGIFSVGNMKLCFNYADSHVYGVSDV